MYMCGCMASTKTDSTTMMQVLVDKPNSDRGPNRLYSLDFKLQVLDWYYENGEKKGETCRKFNVNRKALQNWLLLEKQLRTRTQFVRIEKIPYHYKQKLEKNLLDWFKKQKAKHESTSTPAVRAKALEIAADLGIESFKASRTWVKQWKKRNKVDTIVTDDPSVHVVTVSPPPPPPDVTATLPDKEDMNTEECAAEAYDWILGGIKQDTSQSNSPLTILKHNDKELPSWNLKVNHSLNFSQQSPHVQTQSQDGNNSTLMERLSEHEQWISMVQQTVESLEVDMTSKIAQMKLVLQQLKTSIHETRALAQLGESSVVDSKRLCLESQSNATPPPRKV